MKQKIPIKMRFGLLIAAGLLITTGWADTTSRLGMEDAVSTALAKHPTLIQYQEAIKQAKYQLVMQKSAYLPQVNVKAQYSKGKTEDYPSEDSYTGYVTGTQFLFDFGKTPALVKQYAKAVDEKKLALTAAEIDVIYNVKAAYLNALKAKQQLEIAKETKESAKLHLRLAMGFYEVGKVAKLDVSKAEVEVANAELALVTAENDYRLAQTSLINTMGLDVSQQQSLELVDTQYQKEATPVETLLEEAVNNRPDYKAYKVKQEEYKAAVLEARLGHVPTVSMFVTGYSTGNGFPLTETGTAGVGVEMPLFNGFQTEANLRRVQSGVKGLQAEQKKALQDLQLEVTNYYLLIQSEQEKIVAAEKLVKQAEESLKLATGRYENGLGTMLDVTDAQVSYTDARVSLAQVIYDYQIDCARLYKALGRK